MNGGLMTQQELARAIAADMGTSVEMATEKALRGERTMGLGLTEVLAIGAFIAQIAPDDAPATARE